MTRTPATIVTIVVLALLAAAPVLAGAEAFWLFLLTRLMLLAVAATALNWVMGFAGLPSFAHAALVGVGAYAVGIAAAAAAEGSPWLSAWLQFPVAVLAAGTAAAVIGAISLRTRGIAFILITLAFGQMLFYGGVALEPFGGDDGMTLAHPSTAGVVDLGPGPALYYVVLALLAVLLALSARLAQTPFGLALRAGAVNEVRLRGLGVPLKRLRVAAFTASGAVCGLAGALTANQAGFVSPASMEWSRSAELVAIVLLGGAGTVSGPLFGAAAFVVLEELLSEVTEHWRIVFGPLLVLVVLFARGGLTGLLNGRRND